MEYFIIILTWLSTLPVFMIFNRIRGGGMYHLTDKLPGRALYYVSIIFGGLTAAILDPYLGLIVAFGFLIGNAPGWGLWFDLHREDDKQKDDKRHNDLFVKAINSISFGSDYIALFWRLSLFTLPMIAAWCYWSNISYLYLLLAIPFGLLSLVAYELRWYTSWKNTLSEMLMGSNWWLLILVLYLL